MRVEIKMDNTYTLRENKYNSRLCFVFKALGFNSKSLLSLWESLTKALCHNVERQVQNTLSTSSKRRKVSVKMNGNWCK